MLIIVYSGIVNAGINPERDQCVHTSTDELTCGAPLAPQVGNPAFAFAVNHLVDYVVPWTVNGSLLTEDLIVETGNPKVSSCFTSISLCSRYVLNPYLMWHCFTRVTCKNVPTGHLISF
jgi:hypothetical protein